LAGQYVRLFFEIPVKDILIRISESSPNEGSIDLCCRLTDCAHEIAALRTKLSLVEPGLTEQEIGDIAGGCMETGRYNLFMTYVKDVLRRKA
jgi:hypothetical protein